jgi:hypothetical protein
MHASSLRKGTEIYHGNTMPGIQANRIRHRAVSQPWHCGCGQLVDSNNAAQALRLLGFPVAEQPSTMRHQTPCTSVRRRPLRAFLSREVPHMHWCSSTTNTPRARGNFNCRVRSAAGGTLGDVSCVHPLASSHMHHEGTRGRPVALPGAPGSGNESCLNPFQSFWPP